MERVACFLINSIHFSELCGTENSAGAKIIIDGNVEHLGYDKNNLLGKGTFKTAHLASIKWVSDPPYSGLGAQTSEAIHIALKRPYDDSRPGVSYSEKSLDNALGASSSMSHRAAYLLEELLPTRNMFIKLGNVTGLQTRTG